MTPIYHAATQYFDLMVGLLLNRGAGLSVRAKVPGHYERPDELVECTPLEYATLFPGGETRTAERLRQPAAWV